MENFTIYNPVNLHFGKGVLSLLPSTINQYGEKILLIYGKSSIKTTGLYAQLMTMLDGFTIFEYDGIKSNPLVQDADAAAKIARDNDVDVILAVGGGSVIDTAKMVSIGANAEHSVWEYMIGNEYPSKSIPLFAVLTLAATGTEMNPFAVLQNEESKRKIGYGHPFMYPKESYLDPQFTTTVSAEYTVYGIVDLIAHALEAYFGKGDSPLADRFVYSIIEEAMEAGPQLLKNLDSYELRARIMYAATMALNGTTSHGRISGDWGVHGLGHELSLLFDVAHGASLSIAYPAWMRLMKDKAGDRITELGSALFGAQDVEETASEFEAFFKSIGAPTRLSDAKISVDDFPRILSQWNENKVSGVNYKMEKNDHEILLDLMA
jgi:alcohol dehydrogenase YqhD (iron-dependent ADH family)